MRLCEILTSTGPPFVRPLRRVGYRSLGIRAASSFRGGVDMASLINWLLFFVLVVWIFDREEDVPERRRLRLVKRR